MGTLFTEFFSTNMANTQEILKMRDDVTFLKAFVNFTPGVRLLFQLILRHLAKQTCELSQQPEFVCLLTACQN